MWQQLKQFIKQLIGPQPNRDTQRGKPLTVKPLFQSQPAKSRRPTEHRWPHKLNKRKLSRYNLPQLANPEALASWLNISLGRLFWFTYRQRTDRVWHYYRFTISKRTGGERVILAPKAELKAIQQQILNEILARVPVHSQAHGFVNGRSIVTNATPHIGQAYVLNLDLKDFFPTITYARVCGLFSSLGYPLYVARELAFLCTTDDRQLETRLIDNKKTKLYVSHDINRLVQGAPTSPAISNLIARRLDARLYGLARSMGFTYTRYADDLTFSGPDKGKALRILDDFMAHLVGLIAHVHNVNAEQGQRSLDQVTRRSEGP
jgi:RNA-directed DNA polymerase